MNTNIIKKINLILQGKETKDEREEAMYNLCLEVVYAHNLAVSFGFVDLPKLECRGGDVDLNGDMTLSVATRSDNCEPINIDDLYVLRGAWGADNLEVYGDGTIELTFRNK